MFAPGHGFSGTTRAVSRRKRDVLLTCCLIAAWQWNELHHGDRNAVCFDIQRVHEPAATARFRGGRGTLINPSLSPDQLKRLALFISASMEGHTIFIGHGKPWKKETENVISMATQSFLWLIKSGTIPG